MSPRVLFDHGLADWQDSAARTATSLGILLMILQLAHSSDPWRCRIAQLPPHHPQSSCTRADWVQIVLCSADAHFPIRRPAGRDGIGLPIRSLAWPLDRARLPEIWMRWWPAIEVQWVANVKERPSQRPILDQPGMQGYRAGASLPLAGTVFPVDNVIPGTSVPPARLAGAGAGAVAGDASPTASCLPEHR